MAIQRNAHPSEFSYSSQTTSYTSKQGRFGYQSTSYTNASGDGVYYKQGIGGKTTVEVENASPPPPQQKTVQKNELNYSFASKEQYSDVSKMPPVSQQNGQLYHPGPRESKHYEGPLGGRAAGFSGPNVRMIGGEGPNGRRGGAFYIPGVAIGFGGFNPANGNRGGAIITADGIAVKGNVNGQAFQNSWAF